MDAGGPRTIEEHEVRGALALANFPRTAARPPMEIVAAALARCLLGRWLPLAHLSAARVHRAVPRPLALAVLAGPRWHEWSTPYGTVLVRSPAAEPGDCTRRRWAGAVVPVLTREATLADLGRRRGVHLAGPHQLHEARLTLCRERTPC